MSPEGTTPTFKRFETSLPGKDTSRTKPTIIRTGTESQFLWPKCVQNSCTTRVLSKHKGCALIDDRTCAKLDLSFPFYIATERGDVPGRFQVHVCRQVLEESHDLASDLQLHPENDIPSTRTRCAILRRWYIRKLTAIWRRHSYPPQTNFWKKKWSCDQIWCLHQ